MTLRIFVLSSLWILLSFGWVVPALGQSLTGRVVDGATGDGVASRVYLQSLDDGEYFHVAALQGGKAIPYDVRRGAKSLEVHTTLSAHAFRATLPQAGKYRIVIEKGKAWIPHKREFSLKRGEFLDLGELELVRWINPAARGWFSGETHIHRRVDDLKTLVLAEDLNVALPLTAWVTDSQHRPDMQSRGGKVLYPAGEIRVTPQHVIWPINTEYEIFTVNGKAHTLGAVFILNHRSQLALTAPPVGVLAAEARRQGAILDLDKHNWPWTIMAAVTMDVDLFELTNNHLWRTEFLFKDWYPEYAADFMQLSMKEGAFTEESWIDFGFKTYYAMLNCGLKMKPTGGTASGVHPVPLGYGRVYVYLDGDFSYAKWIDGLRRGRSFVTTGPFLDVRLKAHLPGDTLSLQSEEAFAGSLSLRVDSLQPRVEVEVIYNGDVLPVSSGRGQPKGSGGFEWELGYALPKQAYGWVAVRVFERDAETGRSRFAHSGPFYLDRKGASSTVRQEEVDYFVGRLESELKRHWGVLPETALQEYEKARRWFRALK